MTNGLVTAAHYLTYQEAVALYQALQQLEIGSLVKSCGPPRFPYMEGAYFSILIRPEDQATAQATLDQFSEKQALLTQWPSVCQACGSQEVVPVTKLPWYKKLYYIGTSVSRCQNCQATFFQ